MLFSMELIFEVRESEEGGYTARAPGHSIFAKAETWEALRENVREAAALHFQDAPAPLTSIRLHLVKDEVIDAHSGDLVRMNPHESWLQNMEPTLTTPLSSKTFLPNSPAANPSFIARNSEPPGPISRG
jgi:predicted RNase H-like HicB family nuclease